MMSVSNTVPLKKLIKKH